MLTPEVAALVEPLPYETLASQFSQRLRQAIARIGTDVRLPLQPLPENYRDCPLELRAHPGQRDERMYAVQLLHLADSIASLKAAQIPHQVYTVSDDHSKEFLVRVVYL